MRGVARYSADTANYVSLAQYYFRYADGTDGGLSPIDQYASIYSGTRFASPAILGIFAQFSGADFGLALLPFSGLLLMNVFAGFTILARNLRCYAPISIAAGVFAVLLGWVPNILYAGSLDNLLFLALLPFLIVRLSLIPSGTTNVRSILALGVCGAAAVYAYPEGIALGMVIFLPVFLGILRLSGRRRFGYMKLGLAAVITLAFVLPYARTFFPFIFRQIHVATHLRVGDNIFPGLSTSSFLPAVFAFGEEFAGVGRHSRDTLLAIVLILLIVGGLIRWCRRNRTFAWAFFVFLCVSFWQSVLSHYSYGFYKVLTVGSILIIPAIFAGVEEVYFRCTGMFRRAGPLVLACVLSGFVASVVWRNFDFTPKRFRVSLEPYSDLRNLGAVTQGAPVSLMCDNDFDQTWALTYLGDQPQEVRFKRGIELFPAMMRAKKANTAVKFFLVNRKMEGALWTNSKFWLVPISKESAPVVAVDSPNGIEEVQGAALAWLSDRPTSFIIDSLRDGPATLWAKKVRMSSTQPVDSIRTVILRDASGRSEHEVNDAFYACISLNKGLNRVELSCEDKPTIKQLPSGHTRPLLLGLEDYQVKQVSSELNLVGIVRSPNGLESYQGMPFVWLSNESTALLITSPRDGNAFLEADKVLLGPSIPGLSTRTVVVKCKDSKTEWTVKDTFSIPISLTSGLNLVEIWCTDVPVVKSLPNGETRVLLLGLLNYRVKEAAK
jgi:hypothetical protein